MEGALVCGFSDEASQVAGVAWSIEGENGAVLTRSADHAAEQTSAWLLERDGATHFVEALLSTQYGPDGLPSRVGLELWRDDPDAPAMRAAGAHPVRVRGSGSNATSAALLHTSADGTTGIGDYLIVRRNE